MSTKRILFIASAWLLLILFSTADTPPERPNIVIIMVDDMGWSDIGCYGGEIPTPHIDSLAEGGIRFTQFYNTSRCCPTRASLLTGLYQHQTGIGHMTTEGRADFDFGVDGFRGRMNLNCVTLAEVLKTVGYSTCITGKWHLGSERPYDRPLQRGFDQFYGSLSGAFSFFKPHGERGLMLGNQRLEEPDPEAYYATDAFSDYAVDFVNKQSGEAPFFLYVAYNAPHWPLHAKEEDIEKFVGKFTEGWDVLRRKRFERQVAMGIFDEDFDIAPRDSNVRPWSEVDAQQKKDSDYRMAVYAAQMYSVDYGVGKIMDAIRDNGELDNTLIIFLSDNGACAEPYNEFGGGEMSDINDPDNGGIVSYGRGWANLSNTPFREYKNRPQEGGIATPMIAHWPDGINSDLEGAFVRDVAHIIDFMPTVLEISGAEYPRIYRNELIHPYEGESLTPFFTDGEREAPEFYFFEHSQNCAVRMGDWKIIGRYAEWNWELYNIVDDRNELNNLASKHPEIVDEMAQAWERWALRVNAAPRGVRTPNSYD